MGTIQRHCFFSDASALERGKSPEDGFQLSVTSISRIGLAFERTGPRREAERKKERETKLLSILITLVNLFILTVSSE